MTVFCERCVEPRYVGCTREQYQQWANGALIQNAMADVPKEQRELLISGICGGCWLEMFKPKKEKP